jgi:hypothetical protein
MNSAVLFSAYFPNIQYISKFLLHDDIIIDIYENYIKQTYRNRCEILAANGPLSLVVPVKKNNHCLTKDIQIDYSENWQKVHERTILSSYKNSPFYEYYIDYFVPFFSNKEKYLLDFNNKILETILNILSIKPNVSFSNEFVDFGEYNYKDIIHPKLSKKKYDNEFCPEHYIQIFSEKYGFVENLSTLDLIFSEGPLSLSTIKKSIHI